MFDEKFSTDVIYYSKKNCEIGRIKNCKYINDFVFCRNEFMLCNKTLNFYVCISKDGEMLSVWSHPMKYENGTDVTPSEVMSLFRRKYTENNITNDMIDTFLNKPKTYKKKFLKK